jgi:hypothetical protein
LFTDILQKISEKSKDKLDNKAINSTKLKIEIKYLKIQNLNFKQNNLV